MRICRHHTCNRQSTKGICSNGSVAGTDRPSLVCRRASPDFCASLLETLAALLRAAALAAAQQALPSLSHLSELLGALLAAAPDAVRLTWRTRMCQVMFLIINAAMISVMIVSV